MQDRQAELVSKALQKLRSFSQSDSYDTNKFSSVQEYVERAMATAFGENSYEYRRLEGNLQVSVFINDDHLMADRRHKAVISAISSIESIKEIHSEVFDFDPELNTGAMRVAHASSKKVFVVHGHNDALRERTARFLERAGLEPIILSEQAGGGDTIIEKLERYSDVAFAVVLLTPDDEGGLVGGAKRPRARQNVVFELGYFVGLLARKRVCALLEPTVEIFSDINGVNYIEVDTENAWKTKLARELKHAGFNVDLNALL